MSRFSVIGGRGIIDIVSDGFASCLTTSWATVLDWPDCGGSVARYYALSEHAPAERHALVRELDDALAEGDELRIEHAMPEFLQLFADGTYPLAMYSFGREYESYHVAEREYYPSGYRGFALSQPIENLDLDRVRHYQALIRGGGQPKVLCYQKVFAHSRDREEGDAYYTETWESPYYVLDGHHKLAAYRALDVPPPVVVIWTEVEGPTAYERGKTLLFERAEAVLRDDEARLRHLVTNAPQMLLSDEAWVERYNAVLDAQLRERRGQSSPLPQLLQRAFRTQRPEALAWLLARLEALRHRAETGQETTLNYPEENAWNPLMVRSTNDFDDWCNKMFGKDYASLLELMRSR